jgi:CRISPR-associated protein Csm5
MSFLQQYQLSITPLSPVHIGCGETYEPTNYIINNDALYEFSPFEAMRALDQKDREILNKIVNSKASEQMLNRVQAYFYQRREALLAASTHYLPVVQGVAELYRSRIGEIAQQESQHKGVINKLEIQRVAYNSVNHLPFFAGSSLKGAIRTALLDSINQGKSLLKGEKNNPLQQRLFEYSFKEMHKDPMRLVTLADAHWKPVDLTATKVYFAVNRRKKHHNPQSRLHQSQAETQGVYQFLECVPALHYRSLEGSLTLHSVEQVNQHQNKLPAKKLQWSMMDIAAACNAFYRPLLTKERRLLTTLQYADPAWLAQLKQIDNTLENNPKGAFLLRLGQHSGAEAMTLNGLRSIKITRNQQATSFEKEATTLWLASANHQAQKGMKTFGWVLVEINANENSPFKPLLETSNQATYNWQQQQQIIQSQAQQVFAKKQAIQHKQRQQQAKKEEEKREQQRQQKKILAEKKSTMSTLAGDFFEQASQENWQENKMAFWRVGVIEKWLDHLEANNDSQLWEQIKQLMEIHFKGVMANPDKTKGKKNKPVYKPRVRQIAKRLLAFQ